MIIVFLFTLLRVRFSLNSLLVEANLNGASDGIAFSSTTVKVRGEPRRRALFVVPFKLQITFFILGVRPMDLSL